MTHRASRSLSIGLGLCASLAFPLQAHAGGTRTFDVSSFADFDAGETEGAAIESSGKVTVGYALERAELPGSTAFTCLAGDGAAYVGTADEASVVRVTVKAGKRRAKASAKSKTNGDAFKVETVAKLEGVVVSAMTRLSNGDLLAATLPGGSLHRVDKRGKVTPFAKLDVQQIWALAVHGNRVYAATGPKGELYSISLDGKDAKVVLDVDERDLLSLLVVGNAVVVGTAPQAKLYQVTDELEGALLHDFAGDEVRALALTKTGLVAAVNRFGGQKISSLDALTKTLDRASLVGKQPAGELRDSSPIDAQASVHFVELGSKRELARASELPWEQWLSRDKQYFTALLATEAGESVLVSSSSGGKVYRLQGLREVATIADLEEHQATGLCQIPGGPVLATAGHGAAAYRLESGPAANARFRTEVLDAGQPANWGAVTIRGTGKLGARVRVGPSEQPDGRWSGWQNVSLQTSGLGQRGSLGKLPHRRYLQLEVTLPDRTSELRSTEIFYAPENLAPLLTRVEVDGPSFDVEDAQEPSSDVTIKWEADARDEDELAYAVQVRPEGASQRESIRLHDEGLVSSKQLKWDLTTVPDGVYEIVVVATDEPTNGNAQARTDELVSAPFIVDRTRPVVSGGTVRGSVLKATASDQGGYIHDVGVSIDGGPFRSASPEDGLFDDASETLVFTLPQDLSKGTHRVVIRARDSHGNIGNLAVVLTR